MFAHEDLTSLGEQAISPDIANGVSHVLKGVLTSGGSAPKRAIVCRMLPPRRPVRTISLTDLDGWLPPRPGNRFVGGQ